MIRIAGLPPPDRVLTFYRVTVPERKFKRIEEIITPDEYNPDYPRACRAEMGIGALRINRAVHVAI